ncbi:hypothetical protein ABZ070_28665 [Streptomyces sp. NPDC006283]|uniref:hypothetical protein n=1 Tax=Streptomyces sp. NPDC006283 TaxID=3156741 RepID=UPI0033A57DE6
MWVRIVEVVETTGVGILVTEALVVEAFGGVVTGGRRCRRAAALFVESGVVDARLVEARLVRTGLFQARPIEAT